jgi:hypothetical protein
VREVPERLVRHDEHPLRALGQAGLELAVQRLEVGAQPVGVGVVVVGVVRVGLGQPVGDGGGDRLEVGRVEPDVRVAGEVAVGVALVALLLGVLFLLGVLVVRVLVAVLALGLVEQLDQARDVDGAILGVLLDCLVDRRLEPAQVHDEVGVGDLADLPRRQLEVVRLAAGLGQVVDGGVLARDLLGHERQRIEGRGDGETVAAARGGVVVAAAGEEEPGQGGGAQRGHGRTTGLHGTHSHQD